MNEVSEVMGTNIPESFGRPYDLLIINYKIVNTSVKRNDVCRSSSFTHDEL